MTSETRFFRWAVPAGLGLSLAAWYPLSSNPGVIGKFLGLYVLGGLLALWTIKKTLSADSRVNLKKMDLILIAVFLAAAGVSALASLNMMTIIGHSKHREGLLVFLFYVLVYILAADEDRIITIESIAAIMGAALVLNLAIGFTAFEQALARNFGERFTGGYAEPNFLAGFLVIAIPLAAILIVNGRTIFERALGVAGVASGVMQLFMSGSRSGYLALLVAVITLSAAAWLMSKSRFRALYPLTPVALATWGILSARFSLSSLQEGARARYSTWLSINDTWDYLFIGPGPGRFQVASENRHLMIGPHNTFINMAGNIGWLATLAYVLLILYAIYRCIAYIRSAPRRETIAASLLLASIVGYTVFGFLSYTRSYTNIVFWALLGLAAAFVGERRTFRLPGAFRAGVAVTLIVVVMAVAGQSLSMIASGRHAYLALRTQDAAERWQHLSQAIRYEPWNAEYRVNRGAIAFSHIKTVDRGELDHQVVAGGAEDWSFLYREILGDTNSYRILDSFYFFSGTRGDKAIEPPPEYDPEPVRARFGGTTRPARP